jgi:hypothetical protein
MTAACPLTIHSSVQKYQLLWMPDSPEEKRGGTQAMLVSIDVAIQRESSAALQFIFLNTDN